VSGSSLPIWLAGTDSGGTAPDSHRVPATRDEGSLGQVATEWFLSLSDAALTPPGGFSANGGQPRLVKEDLAVALQGARGSLGVPLTRTQHYSTKGT